MVGLRSPTRDPQAGTPGAPDLVPPYGHAAVRDPDILFLVLTTKRKAQAREWTSDLAGEYMVPASGEYRTYHSRFREATVGWAE